MYFPGKEKIIWVNLWQEDGGVGNRGSRLLRLGSGGRLDAAWRLKVTKETFLWG